MRVERSDLFYPVLLCQDYAAAVDEAHRLLDGRISAHFLKQTPYIRIVYVPRIDDDRDSQGAGEILLAHRQNPWISFRSDGADGRGLGNDVVRSVGLAELAVLDLVQEPLAVFAVLVLRMYQARVEAGVQ